MFRLTPAQQTYLLSQPESGMGYQFVEILTETSRRLVAVAYYAELVLPLDDSNLQAQFESYAAGFAVSGDGTGLREISVRSRDLSSPTCSVAEGAGIYGSWAGPAVNGPRIHTKLGDVYKRFSAFPNDRRIRPDKSLLPGTYATTAEDARHVHTGKDAVARYALPNPIPAVHVFTITPQPATPAQIGVVEPANAQPGGGVEVIFTAGTTAGTVSEPVSIPTK